MVVGHVFRLNDDRRAVLVSQKNGKAQSLFGNSAMRSLRFRRNLISLMKECMSISAGSGGRSSTNSLDKWSLRRNWRKKTRIRRLEELAAVSSEEIKKGRQKFPDVLRVFHAGVKLRQLLKDDWTA